MLYRDFEEILLSYTKMPAIAILGPRQAGKTTLAQAVFKKHVYTNFEDPDTRELARTDPRQFLRIYQNDHGIIIDEFQHVPELLSYLQLEIDEHKRPGYFILTGSHNFLMNQAITQSLAGRIAILNLLPLSLHELATNNILANSVDEVMFNGGYPRIYAEGIAPGHLYPSYIQSYLERDVRQLINVGDLSSFQRFIKLCAGRIGQQLNLSEIGGVCGVSSTTAGRWLSILQASYTVFLLQPYFNNFNKRLTKSPKLYFYDTGLACTLLDIESPQSLALSPFRGSLFECFVIADICKQYYNIGKRPPVYYWRDLNGRLEVDCIIEQETKLFPLEIKSGETIASDYFDQLTAWSELAQTRPQERYVVYGGNLVQQRSKGHVLGWQAVGTLVKHIRRNRTDSSDKK